jgi:hypothetical protein
LIEELSEAEHDQYDPALLPDELTIYFRSEPRVSGSGRSAIVRATRTARWARWGVPQIVSEIDAPEAWNLSPEPSSNELRLWFSSDRAGTRGGLDLWVAVRDEVELPWSAPQNLAELNSAEWDTDCAVSSDELELIFSRRSSGQADLFISRRSSVVELWSPPEAIPELVTGADEWDAALALDGLLMLFTSPPTQPSEIAGELHIYESRRSSKNDPFSAPVLLEELAAPFAIDEDPWISNDGRRVVFASTRSGRRHLYQSEREILQ